MFTIRRKLGDRFSITFDSTKIAQDEVAHICHTWGFLVPHNSLMQGADFAEVIQSHSSHIKAKQDANKIMEASRL